MGKKLTIAWLSLTIITCSSISIYATTQKEGNGAELNSNPAISELTAVAVNDTNKEVTDIRTEAKAQLEAQAEEERRQAERQSTIDGITNYIMSTNRNVGATEAAEMAGHFADAADNYEVDVYYLVAIAKRESTFNVNATSSANCRGLMQTSDALAARYGYSSADAYNLAASIDIGAQYLRSCLDTFGGDYISALSGYNYGCGAVKAGRYSTRYAGSVSAVRDAVMSYA